MQWSPYFRESLCWKDLIDICKIYQCRLYKVGVPHYNAPSFKTPGGIAQLGERLHGMQEVSGSIPLTSTKKSNLKVTVPIV